MQVVKNKKAFFDYEILETLEVGIVLHGHEVKSVKQGGLSLKDSYVIIKNEELFLLNASIARYECMSQEDYDPNRTRKLLASKKQIISLSSKIKQGNLTLVPLKGYVKRKKVKIEIGLVRGKKKYEKRQDLKKKELEKELHREKREYMV